jgi:hypothetical protein
LQRDIEQMEREYGRIEKRRKSVKEGNGEQ